MASESSGPGPVDSKPPASAAPTSFLRRITPRSAAAPVADDGGVAGSVWERLLARRSSRPQVQATPDDDQAGFSTIIVEPDDTLATICGKLDTTRLNRAAVLIPRGNAELGRGIGMRLLMRHADITGKEIVLVSRRHAIRQRAQAEGQPCVSRERGVRFQGPTAPMLRLGGLDLALPSLRALLAITLLAAFVVLAFAAVFWYLPVATLTIYPPSTLAQQDQSLTIDSATTHVNASSGILPAARRQVTVTRTVLIPATGSSDAGPTVADADLKTAQDLAPAALIEGAVAEFQQRYGQSELFFPESAQVQVSRVDPNHQSGDPASLVEVSYRGSVSMLSVHSTDLRQLFTGLLRQKLQNDQALVDSSLQFSVVKAGPYDKDADKLPAQLHGQAGVIQALDSGAIRQTLRSRRRRDAIAYVDRTISPVRPTVLKLSPGWVPWLPRVTSHIHLDLRASN